MKALYIEWIDSSGLQGCWHDVETFKNAKLVTCKTIGFVVDENAETITLVGSHNPDGDQVSGDMTIPKTAIKKRRVINWKP